MDLSSHVHLFDLKLSSVYCKNKGIDLFQYFWVGLYMPPFGCMSRTGVGISLMSLQCIFVSFNNRTNVVYLASELKHKMFFFCFFLLTPLICAGVSGPVGGAESNRGGADELALPADGRERLCAGGLFPGAAA